MKKETFVSFGGVFAAVLASLCCIGPLLAVGLGVGGLAAFAVFESYRPWLVGFAASMIAVAFYLTFRTRERVCEDGTCRIETGSIRAKRSVWSLTLLAGVAISAPYMGLAPQTPVNHSVESTALVTLHIEGMDCQPCAVGLEGSLASMPGVRKARVDLESSKATIEYDGRSVKATTFIERVEANGYTATIERGK